MDAGAGRSSCRVGQSILGHPPACLYVQWRAGWTLNFILLKKSDEQVLLIKRRSSSQHLPILVAKQCV